VFTRCNRVKLSSQAIANCNTERCLRVPRDAGPNNQKRDLRHTLALIKELGGTLVLPAMYKHYLDVWNKFGHVNSTSGMPGSLGLGGGGGASGAGAAMGDGGAGSENEGPGDGNGNGLPTCFATGAQPALLPLEQVIDV
jgi:hypothetical protein